MRRWMRGRSWPLFIVVLIEGALLIAAVSYSVGTDTVERERVAAVNHANSERARQMIFIHRICTKVGASCAD